MGAGRAYHVFLTALWPQPAQARAVVAGERHVRADNTFSFKSLRFEAPRHLPDRTIHLRFQRSSPADRVIVYYKGERMGQARLLDAIANDRKPLTPPSTAI